MANMKYAYLLFVSPQDNHNKFYEMRQTSATDFEVTFGRVGATKPQHAEYPMAKWSTKYNEKTNKGYQDRTKEHVGVGEEKLAAQKVSTGEAYLPISDKSVNDLVIKLMSVSAQMLRENYTIELDNVTDYMLTKAQESLNRLYTINREFQNAKNPDTRSVEDIEKVWDKVKSALKRKDLNYPHVTDFKIKSEKDVSIAYYRGIDFLQKVKDRLTPVVYKNILANMSIIWSEGVKLTKTQSQINDLSLVKFNQELNNLFSILPRKMKKVQDYLAASPNQFDSILLREQNLYDTMEGAYKSKKRRIALALKKAQKQGGTKGVTLLEANGLRMRPCTSEEIEEVKKLLGEISDKFSRAWRVENVVTQEKYDSCRKDLKITQRGIKNLWHGSTTENWWSILTNGLSLNPNASITGKMFGNGIYFAPKARKSLGYTSIRGSYWARGGDSTGYMGLFSVACGKPWDVHSSAGRFYNFGFKDLRGGCTYVHAHAGHVLRNDEIIVYREDQLTIKYFVELK